MIRSFGPRFDSNPWGKSLFFLISGIAPGNVRGAGSNPRPTLFTSFHTKSPRTSRRWRHLHLSGGAPDFTPAMSAGALDYSVTADQKYFATSAKISAISQ
jgi:hypothetical protein